MNGRIKLRKSAKPFAIMGNILPTQVCINIAGEIFLVILKIVNNGAPQGNRFERLSNSLCLFFFLKCVAAICFRHLLNGIFVKKLLIEIKFNDSAKSS